MTQFLAQDFAMNASSRQKKEPRYLASAQVLGVALYEQR